jgi:hypothetical protein
LYRAAAANIISKLASGEHAINNRLMLGHEPGAITSLICLLKYGSSKAKETAIEALENLALNDWNKRRIVQEGGIECLMQLLENGTFAEQEAATTTLKILKISTSHEETQQQEEIDGSKNHNDHDVEQSNQPITNTSGNVENMENVELCKPIDHENRNFTYKKEATSDVPSTITMNELQHSNNHVYGNLQISKDLYLRQKGFLRKNLVLPRMQNTSELTSTLAPPLIGHPSMQVDAILVNIKKSMESNMQSCKRMKMNTPHTQGNQNANVPPKRSNTLIESKVQNCNQSTTDPMQMRFLDANKRSKELFYQRNQCFSPNEGYGLVDAMRDQQNRQCLVVDNQLVAGGIVALVNALSSPNPSAQEFSALALVLLASQGGFEVKTAISNAGIFFHL